MGHTRVFLFQGNQLVFLAPDANLFGIVECVHAVARVDTFYQMYLPVVARRTHEVGASLVERNRVERSEFDCFK